MPYLQATRHEDVLRLAATGEWRARALQDMESEIDDLPVARAGLDAVRRVEIDASGVDSLDLSGAWLLHDLAQRVRAAGLEVAWAGGAPPATVALVDGTLGTGPGAAFVTPAAPDFRPVTTLGRTVVARWDGVKDGLAFTGEAAVRLVRGIPSLKSWRMTSVVRHVHETGIKAIPIVALIAFLISVILAYMSAEQLLKFGADIFVVDLITIAVLREMGVLLTAIIVAGRSGSAFAAEIGAMKLNEETDALRAIGISPMEVLVLPRVIGLVVALPLLTVIADAVGIAGGALLCYGLLDMPLVQYIQRVHETVGPWTFWVGIIKAPVFALLIAAAGTYRGMQVRGSSRELGRLTTVAVVQAIFLVILANALFAVLFMEMGI
jgi:phospholipid/cholesterol/gamma-HCH transport system permease protein